MRPLRFRSAILAATVGASLLGPLVGPTAAQTGAVDGPPLLCMGTAQPFLLSIFPEGDGTGDARFDYLGDGTFPFSPMPAPGALAPGYRLETAGGPLDVTLEPRACPALGIELPLTIRIGVPAGGAILTYRGCCLWQER